MGGEEGGDSEKFGCVFFSLILCIQGLRHWFDGCVMERFFHPGYASFLCNKGG